jgi:hypothetical protein
MSTNKENYKSNKLTDVLWRTGYKYSFKTPDPLVLYAVLILKKKEKQNKIGIVLPLS